MGTLIGMKCCFSHVFEDPSELHPPTISVIPAHVEAPSAVPLYSRAQSTTIHKYGEIVSRLFEHSPQISHCDFELFLHRSSVLSTGRLTLPAHCLDSDAYSVDSEGSSNWRSARAGRSRQEAREWKCRRIKNPVKGKR